MIGTKGRFPSRNHSTKAQEAICEITVATAAPRTPMPSTKINTGSRAMLAAAPMITENMPVLANPWQMMNWHIPVESSANTVPARYQLRYSLA